MTLTLTITNMAFSQREQAILLNIKEKGGTAQDAIEAINNFRTGKKRETPRFSEAVQNYGERTAEQFTKGVSRIGEAITGGAENILNTKPGSYERARGAALTGTESASGALQAGFAPITAALEPAVKYGLEKTKQGIDVASDTTLLQKIATNPVVSKTLDTIFGGLDKAKQWITDNPQEAKILANTAELATVGSGATPAKEALVRGGSAVAETTARGARALGGAFDETINSLKKVDVPVFGTVKTAETLNHDALKAAAELLQSGSKKAAKGRAVEFNNADTQAMRLIRDTLRPLKSQQELATFFDDAISVYQKNREDILRPFMQNEVTDAYQSPLKSEIKSLMQSGDMKSASAYSKFLAKEKQLFEKSAKQATGGKNTVVYLQNRIKDVNQRVQSLFDEVGGRENLLPEQKIQVQAYEKLREGLKKELDTIGGKQYAELGQVVSGLIDARTFARIQRDRAKNALSDAPWETMTLKERALFIKDLFPTLKDFGVNALVKLDTKADVLDALVEQKVRQIRQFGNKALETSE